MTDKRNEIIQRLQKEGLDLTYSSPRIRSFWIISSAPEHKPSFEDHDFNNFMDEDAPATILPDIGGVGEEIQRQEESRLGEYEEPEAEQEEEEEPDIESMTPKEFKKYKKQKEREAAAAEKQKKKEAKEFNTIRKDAHKRGYDTSVLMQLESPEQLYDFSDDEIDQIQAAGYINDDGFYDFVYPPDAEDLQREPISTKVIILVLILFLFIGGMLALMFSGMSNMF